MKKWMVKSVSKELSNKLALNGSISNLCANVLVSLGATSPEDADKIINPAGLSDPFLIKDMDKAVATIERYVQNNSHELICIYGDYDCDGITSTAILYSYLEYMGANVTYYIPERSEGYGMNENSIRKLHEKGVKLIITVDNGISAIPEANLIKELGMELIVTDHHQQGEELPTATAIINPHRHDCLSIFKDYCGAGVALQLVNALQGGDEDSANVTMEQFGDLAAIGTIADIVPLERENRFIASQGLKLLENTENIGLNSLKECSGCTEKLNSYSVGFMLGPRINASGRFGSPLNALRLLLSQDEDEAYELAQNLTMLNNDRKHAEKLIIEEIERQIDGNPSILNNRVLVFSGDNWNHGVIGIAASKLMERFNKPCFIVTIEGELARGSARSFGDFSVFDALTYCKDVFTKFGGHKAAGGFSLLPAKIPDLIKSLQEYALSHHKTMPISTITAVKILEPDDLSIISVSELAMLEPFGQNNPEPIFAIKNATVLDVLPLGKTNLHTRLNLNIFGNILNALVFGISPQDFPIKKGEQADFMATLEVSTYNNSRVVLKIKDYRKSGFSQDKYLSALSAFEQFMRGETLPANYLPRMIPTDEELREIYKCIPTIPTYENSILLQNEKIVQNICKLKLAMLIFSELSLVDYFPSKATVNRKASQNRVNLSDSQLYNKIRNGRM